MVTEIWVNIGSGIVYCLMAQSHYLNQSWLNIIGIHPSEISQKMHKKCLQKLSSEMKFSKTLMHLPGDNELTHCDM